VSSQLTTGSAARITLDLPGGSIAGLQAGNPDGRPALLVPGFTGSKEDFGPILDPLAAAAGYRVTAIDLPGQYESPGRGDVAAYTVDALGFVVRAVAAQLGDRVHLLGHSFGGLVSRAAAIGDPAAFVSLTLLSSGPAGLDGGRRARMDLLRPVLMTHGIAAVYDAMQALERAEPGYVARPAALSDFLRRRFLASDPAMLLGMGEALVDEPDRVDALIATGLPLLVVYGTDDDAWTPDVQAQMAKRLGVAAVEIPAAHSPAIDDPSGTVAALVAFWRST
jgi:pimeloyl-ACP methyl ester carboxylesterase